MWSIDHHLLRVCSVHTYFDPLAEDEREEIDIYQYTTPGYLLTHGICKNEPKKVTFGTGIESMDYEGRNLLVDFPSVSVMSLINEEF